MLSKVVKFTLIAAVLAVLILTLACLTKQAQTSTPTPKSVSRIAADPAAIADKFADTFFNPVYWNERGNRALSTFSDDFIGGLVDPLDALASAQKVSTYSEAASSVRILLTLDTQLTATNFSNLLFMAPINYGFNDVSYPMTTFKNVAATLRQGKSLSAVEIAEIKLRLDALREAVSKAKTADMLLISEAKLNSLKASVIKGIDGSELFLDGLLKSQTQVSASPTATQKTPSPNPTSPPPTQTPKVTSTLPTSTISTSPTPYVGSRFDWPAARYDGKNSGAATQNTAFGPLFQFVYNFKSTNGKIVSTPIVWQGIAFAEMGIPPRDGGTLVAFDLDSGRQLWTYDTGVNKVSDLSAVGGNLVFVAGDWKGFSSTSGKLYSIDGKTGKLRWSADTRGLVSFTPNVEGPKIYFPSIDSSGMDNISFADLDSRTLSTGPRVFGGQRPNALVSDGVIYTFGVGERFVGVVAESLSGKELWRQSAQAHPLRSIVVTSQYVLIVSYDFVSRTVQAIKRDAGTVVWTSQQLDPSNGGISSVAVNDSSVAVAYRDGIAVISLSNGRIIWNQHSKAPDYFGSPPIIVGSYVVSVVTSGKIVVFDINTGQILSETSLTPVGMTPTGQINVVLPQVSPVAADDKLLVVDSSGSIQVFRMASRPSKP